MKIGIIGPNTQMCFSELYQFGVRLGELIAGTNHTILCGGLGGFMEAVCKGAKESQKSYFGQTIGILPGGQEEHSNHFIDIAIYTGMGIGRNAIIVESSDIILAAGGGAGTLSELAFAWQLNKKVLCCTEFDGWSKVLAGINLDTRNENLFIPIQNINDILTYIAHD